MIRVAVADDEKLARYNIISILQESFKDLSIVEAENGQELLQLIQDKRIDIALVDIRMPRLDGLETMDRCPNRPSIPWVIVSSYAEFPYAKRALSLGALGYILKPPDPAEVREIMNLLIGKLRELRRAEAEKLETRWNQLLQYQDVLAISEKPETGLSPLSTCNSDTGIIIPLIVSMQGPPLPHGMIGAIIHQNCGIPQDALEPVLFHAHNDLGYYEIACYVTRTLNPSIWKGTVLTHLLARLQHDFSLYQIKIISGSPCDALESAAEQIQKMRNLLSYEPLLPNISLGLNEASELLLPYTSTELEAASRMVRLTQNWHRKDWVSCKNNVLDLYFTLEKLGTRLQHKLLQNLEKSLGIAPDLSRHFLDDNFTLETKGELLLLIQQNQVNVREDPLSEILRFIDSHFTEAISIAQIANLFGFSPNYLSTLFHQKIGTTYTNYITNLRMKEARNLLRSGISVKETAWAVGYSDEQHFTKLYKKIMGLPPGSEKKS